MNGCCVNTVSVNILNSNNMIDISSEAVGFFGCPVRISKTALDKAVIDLLGKDSFTYKIFIKSRILARLATVSKSEDLTSPDFLFKVDNFELKSVLSSFNGKLGINIILPEENI